MSLSRSSKIWLAIAIAFILSLLWLTYFYFILSPVSLPLELAGSEPSPDAGSAPVVIERGSGVTEIAQTLAQEQTIRSASAFKLYAILSGSAHQLKPGLYNISRASSTIEIIGLLVAGPAKEISVRIPEGASLAEIDELMAHYGILHRGDLSTLRIADYYDDYPFLRGARSFEGFLFPDTYRFFFDSKPETVIKVLLDTYASRVGPLISDGKTINWDNIPITRRGIFSSLEITTIASMIEKEVPDSADRKLVADIIYRRLRIDMPLQIDATRDYAKKHGSRYDTYEFYGLPPGPIASPGLDAIDAALNPRSSSYLYYISDPKTGKTIFAETFEQHKANTDKYLR